MPVANEHVAPPRGQEHGHAPGGMGDLEALISLLHNRSVMDEDELDRALRSLFPSALYGIGVNRVLGDVLAVGDDVDDNDDEEEDRNLDAEMEE
jgi:hypothetical protein